MNKEKDNIITFKAMLDYILFPKKESLLGTEGNEYGITKWEFLELENGDIPSQFKGIMPNKITVKGDFYSALSYCVNYRIVAKEVMDVKYGVQFEVIHISEIVELETTYQKKAFLSTILTELQLKELFKVYSDPMPYIKNHDIKALSQVKGVGDYIANCIIERYEANKDDSIIYVKLADIGLTPNFIQKLSHQYKNPEKVVDMVKNHPYQLTYDIDGVGFKTADRIALKSGVSPTSSERIASFINYHLLELKEEGQGFLTAKELMLDIYDYFEGKDSIYEEIHNEDGSITNNIAKALKDLEEDGTIIIEKDDGTKESQKNRRIYLKQYYELEKSIAKNLIRIRDAGNDFKYDNWRECVAEQEKKQGFQFTQEQLDGIKLGLDNQVCFITGGAGTGKSTLVSGILSALSSYSFAQCALSGKAASRLQEVTGMEGSTIHRLLHYSPNGGFEMNENNPLFENIIILDELSLVGEDIFNCLLKAIASGTKLIMLGDMKQLESIGEGNLAYDIYNSDLIPVVELTQIQRQAAKSGIITIAHEIRNHRMFMDNDFEGKASYGELKDIHFDVEDSYSGDRSKIFEYFKKAYDSDTVGRDIMKMQLFSPVKERGDTCVFNLNKDAQEAINPKKNNENCVTVKVNKELSFEIRKNDKVLCIKNNYHTPTINGGECEIFNGWTGIVKKILDNGSIVVKFQLAEDLAIIDKSKVKSQLQLGYAITVHKGQGSDIPLIIGVINYSTPPKMLTSQLLYTMITRAKKQCIIVGQNKAINQAIGTDFVSQKRTFLPELLEEKY